MTGEEGYLRGGWAGVNWSIRVIYLIDFGVHTLLFTNIMCLLQIYGVSNFKGRDKLRVDFANEIVAAMYVLCLRCVQPTR